VFDRLCFRSFGEFGALANSIVDFSEITTLYKNRLAPALPQGFGWGAGGVRGKTARKAVWLLGCFLLTPQASLLKPAYGCLVLARRAAHLCRCA
jgi:hypothetical protein